MYVPPTFPWLHFLTQKNNFAPSISHIFADAFETLGRCTAMFDPMNPDYAGYGSSAPASAIRAAVIALLRLAKDRSTNATSFVHTPLHFKFFFFS